MQTKLTADYLINKFGYNIVDRLKDAEAGSSIAINAFLDMIYNDVVINVLENNITLDDAEQVEVLLNTDFKKDTFMRAQAIQAIYTMENGKGAFIEGKQDICPETKNILNKVLKLYQRTMFLK